MDQTDNSVNQESLQTEEIVSKVFNSIQLTNQSLTKAEIQIQTGLSLFNVEDALYVLMEQYPCSLSVNDKGQIIYNFDLRKKRNASGIKEELLKIGGFAKHLFVFIFKLIITLVFFSYSLTIGLAIAVIISALAKSVQPIFVLFIALFEALRMMFIDVKSFFTKEEEPVKESEKNLIAMVFAFAFGSKAAVDSLTREKRILEYIRLNECKITATDLAMITAWSIAKCNDELTLMLTHYKAKVDVSSEGAIIYHFPEFEPIKQPTSKQREQFFIWNNPHQLLSYNNNDKSANQTIRGITIFSVVVSLIVMMVIKNIYNIEVSDFGYLLTFSSYQELGIPYNQSITASVALYLLLFFVFFLLSSFFAKKKNEQTNYSFMRLNNYFKNLKIVFANLPKVKADLFKNLTEKRLFDLSYSMRGELKINDEDASMYYEFKHLSLEMEAAVKQRNGLEYPEITIETVAKIDDKKQQTQILTKTKKARRSFKFKHALLIIIALLVTAGIYFFHDIRTAIVTNNPDKYEVTNIIADHSSILYRFFKTENYEKFTKITLKNVSKEHPVPLFDTLNKIEKFEVYGASCDINLPRKMPKLFHLVLHNISGSIKMPEEMNDLSTVDFKNTNSEIRFPKSVGYWGGISIINNGMQAVHFPAYLKQLQSIHIEKALLDSTFIWAIGSFGMESITVVNNNQSWFPDSIHRVTKLKYLILRNNKLTKIPSGLDKVKDLYKLDLSGNMIKTLPDSLNLTVLTEVRLSRNKISELPASFWSYCCYELYLDSNLISKLPEPDGNTKQEFSTLTLSYNKISSFPDSVRTLREEITELDISNNQFSTFPLQITQFSKLRELNIRNNQIKTIPEEIGELENLTYFRFSGNPITSVPKSFAQLKLNTYSCKFYIDKNWDDAIIKDIKKQAGPSNVFFE